MPVWDRGRRRVPVRPPCGSPPRRTEGRTCREKWSPQAVNVAGATVHQPGRRFGIARQTVSKIFHRHGVSVRMIGLGDERIGEAVRPYEAGWISAGARDQPSVKIDELTTVSVISKGPPLGCVVRWARCSGGGADHMMLSADRSQPARAEDSCALIVFEKSLAGCRRPPRPPPHCSATAAWALLWTLRKEIEWSSRSSM